MSKQKAYVIYSESSNRRFGAFPQTEKGKVKADKYVKELTTKTGETIANK